MDELVLRAVNGLAAHPAWAVLGTVLSSRWMIAVVGVPLGVFHLKRRRFAVVLSVALAMGAADVLVARIIKPLVGRERPCRALEGLVPAARCGAGESFPSGHAAVAFAFLVSAAPTVRLGWLIYTPIAVGVAGSRVLLGVHYPSDVGAGAMFGSLIGLGAGYWRRRREGRAPEAPEVES
ncbi:MAG: phosphatase PAP2 family protein [Deltaproteobacteria bacterium]|nr:phosphatase PAP2 family protein [Deltaproteobacteria bacterium]